MKKLIALFLAVLILLTTSAAVFAAGDAPAGALLRGDANDDGVVTAADARMILRIAAQLDSADGLVFAVLDVDESGDITAQDARMTLRVAAMLDVFEKGEYVTLPTDETTTTDEPSSATEPTSSEKPSETEPTTLPPVTTTQPPADEEPTDVKIIRSGTYEMVLDCRMSGESMKMMLAEDQGNLCLRILNQSLDGLDVLIVNDTMYAAFALNPNSEKKALISETDMKIIMKDSLEDLDEMKTMLNVISHLIPEDLGEPIKTSINGESYFLYTYEMFGAQMQLFVTEEGKISKILMVGEHFSDDEFIIESLSGSLSENYFDLENNYVPLSKIN